MSPIISMIVGNNKIIITIINLLIDLFTDSISLSLLAEADDTKSMTPNSTHITILATLTNVHADCIKLINFSSSKSLQ